MAKYNIEGGIKFYEELYKMLDHEESNNNDVCLITDEKLTENFVTLDCGHKFNYLPLFNDILNHKKKFNSLESKHLNNEQIRCPYCRNKQNKLLPYYENMGIKKVTGVNSLPQPPPGFINGVCNFYDPFDLYIGKCSSHVLLLELNNKTYCGSHYNLMKYKIEREEIRKKKMEEKKKAKEEAKIKMKEEAKKKKEEVKKLKEEAKIKMKEEAKKNEEGSTKIKKKNVNKEKVNKSEEINSQDNSENIIINDSTCSEIVKTGKNKGQNCKCKVYLSTKCKRHYALLVVQQNNIAMQTNEES